MAATPITINYGETFERYFLITGIEFDPDVDRVLFVVRDKKENVLIWKSIVPEFNEEEQLWLCHVLVTHAESEACLPRGSYKYGLTYYHNAVESEDGVPVDGEVVVNIARKAFKVKESVAREEGLR